tara:strand:+ start:1089 stop:2282 length:1194 start_codon:yes stop_codon:yes gene_type:complete
MTTHRNVVICAPVRTAIGTFGGSLKTVPAASLGAAVIEEALKRAGTSPGQVESVVMGHVVQAGAGMNSARQAAIHGGIPQDVPAYAVNRVCGSGAQAIATACTEIISGNINCALAGGMENMDQCPYLLDKARWGYRMGDGKITDSIMRDGLHDAFSGEHAGWHTEDLAARFDITREQQDEWALRSQKRFSEAQDEGKFEAEIVPVIVKSRKGKEKFVKDEHNRPETTLESLAGLKPVFREDGTITAGNAPGINSGAAAMVLAEEKWAQQEGLKPLARIVSYGVGAVDPDYFGLGPVPAVKQALQRAGWAISDVGRIEINEAFSAIAVALAHELKLDESIVNVEGGAIAHGHPIGATGAVLAVRLIHSMHRDGIEKGVVTLCIGGGQGIALCLETIPA